MRIGFCRRTMVLNTTPSSVEDSIWHCYIGLADPVTRCKPYWKFVGIYLKEASWKTHIHFGVVVLQNCSDLKILSTRTRCQISRRHASEMPGNFRRLVTEHIIDRIVSLFVIHVYKYMYMNKNFIKYFSLIITTTTLLLDRLYINFIRVRSFSSFYRFK